MTVVGDLVGDIGNLGFERRVGADGAIGMMKLTAMFLQSLQDFM